MIRISNCPFCDIKNKFGSVHFGDKDYPHQTWIDYGKDDNGNIMWYAILCPEQYTRGHTLIILREHMNKISDSEPHEEELKHLIIGINKVSKKLKEVLDARNIYVLSLCEDLQHLHFHLIPIYKNTKEEEEFFEKNYWLREKSRRNISSKDEFREAIKNKSHNNKPYKINGAWYIAYHEMNFTFSEYWKQDPKERARELEELANQLRSEDLNNPFIT